MRSTARTRRTRAIRDGAIVVASILGILALAAWTSPARAYSHSDLPSTLATQLPA